MHCMLAVIYYQMEGIYLSTVQKKLNLNLIFPVNVKINTLKVMFFKSLELKSYCCKTLLSNWACPMQQSGLLEGDNLNSLQTV